MWPHRWQPTRLPLPWDSPGKNTGVGCHFLLQCVQVKSESEVAQSCPTLSDPMDCSAPGSSIYGIFQARVLEWGAIAFFNTSDNQVQSMICRVAGASINALWGEQNTTFFPIKFENNERGDMVEGDWNVILVIGKGSKEGMAWVHDDSGLSKNALQNQTVSPTSSRIAPTTGLVSAQLRGRRGRPECVLPVISWLPTTQQWFISQKHHGKGCLFSGTQWVKWGRQAKRVTATDVSLNHKEEPREMAVLSSPVSSCALIELDAGDISHKWQEKGATKISPDCVSVSGLFFDFLSLVPPFQLICEQTEWRT